jgi:hypothetical protein
MGVALGEEEVMGIVRLDLEDPGPITDHGHRGVEPVDPDRARGLRKATSGDRGEQPDDRDEDRDHEDGEAAQAPPHDAHPFPS